VLRLSYEPEEEDDEFRWVYVELHMSSVSFFRRIWLAVMYIFGYKCRYGHFGEFVWTKKQVREVRDTLNEFLK
jgi:hypothetical protein